HRDEALESSLVISLLLIGILLVCSAFLSGAEAALFSLTTVQVERLRERGGALGRLITRMLQHPTNLIVTFLVGNEIVDVALAVTVTSLALMIYGAGGEYLAIVATTLILLLCGEITPKSIAVRYPERLSLFMAWPLQAFAYAVMPLRWGLRKLIDATMGTRAERPISLISEEEFKTLVELSEDEGVIDEEERDLIQRVFEFGDQRVSQIMTPRTDIFTLEVNEALSAALPKIKEARFSRIPVYEGTIDQIIGILYAKDLLPYSRHPEPEAKLRDLLHPVFFVPESKRIDELLREFQRNKVHMAIVVDEYGGVSGLVTMEDALEQLVGEIVDEFDTEEVLCRQLDAQSFLVSARLPLDEFNEKLGVTIPRENVDTIGGYVFHLFGKLPKRGEAVTAHGLTFTIEHIKGTRILEIRVRREGA
ncbi:MAG TPA: hemolysin family protein, partial [Gammaproteobacteria bacterium]|nr:hemolysin family protein [Gammaproteobacteria bacterium]